MKNLPGPAKSLTRLEVKSVLSSVKSSEYWRRDQWIIHVMLELGYRNSEVAKIQVGDVINTDGLMQPFVTLSPDGILVTHTWITELRKRVGAGFGPKTFMAGSRKGRFSAPISRTQIWQIVSSAAKASGLSGRVVPMSLLKTRAIRLARKEGMDLKFMLRVLRLLQREMGHTRLETTLGFLMSLEEEVPKIREPIEC